MVVILFILFLAGCSSIDQNHAEFIGKNFVRERVKFFSAEDEGKKDLPQYDISSVTSYREGRLWVVVLHIKSYVDNETKDKDLIVEVDRKGKVVMFNGKRVE